MHRRAGGQADHARLVFDHRQGERFGDFGEERNRARITAAGGGDDKRAFGRGEPLRGSADLVGIGVRLAGLRRTGLGPGESVERLRDHLARQGQVDRAARAGVRDRKTALDDLAQVEAVPQFVVPFHQFTQHAGLVVHFLRPVDPRVAAACAPVFEKGRAPGGEKQRALIARGVHQRADGVRGADTDVQHHRLRPPAGERVAVRHADSEVLMRTNHRRGELQPGLHRARVSLDDRRRVGSGVDIQPVDPARLEQREIRLGDRAYGDGGEFGGVGLHVCSCSGHGPQARGDERRGLGLDRGALEIVGIHAEVHFRRVDEGQLAKIIRG